MKRAMDLEDELKIAVSGAVALREHDRRVLRVTGDDRTTWLNGIVTCDVAKLLPGAFLYGLAVTQKGRIMADFNVILEDDAILVTLPESEASAVKAAWEKYLVMEDCELTLDEEAAVWRVVGLQSANVVKAARALGASTGVQEAGGVVVGKNADASKLEAAFVSAGAILGSAETIAVLSQLVASPRFGVDFDGTLYPQEAALEKRAVSFDKGCYLGQEVVCMLELRGHVKRKLVSLAVDSDHPIEKGMAVTTIEGEKIGEVTSSAKTPGEGVLAIAMVKAAHMAAKTELRIGEMKAFVRDI
ncbi:MAG: YgfZ/GcvT domain-containing protein [Polyangiaceae bacterium]